VNYSMVISWGSGSADSGTSSTTNTVLYKNYRWDHRPRNEQPVTWACDVISG